LKLRERAPGKVNLSLFLGPQREDGRHELVTLFESVLLCDELLVVSAPDGVDRVVCAGVAGPNLVDDAIAGLRARGWQAPPITVEITKRIPVAAGLGGGSADAAALLRIAPQLSPIAEEELAGLAAELGADVPAQLRPGLAVGTGAGEIVRPFAPLAAHAFVIVPLDQRLSTAAVYAEADRLGLSRGHDELEALERELDQSGPRLQRSLLVNDLEPAARELCRGIGGGLEALQVAGADAAFVCGSGPTVAGLFWGTDGEDRAARVADALRRRFPGAVAVAPVSSQASGTMRAS
jgi:4-diphosphocytidyl-2-C-methyl-D-erythritol kinase